MAEFPQFLVRGLPLSTAMDIPFIAKLVEALPVFKDAFATGLILGICIHRDATIQFKEHTNAIKIIHSLPQMVVIDGMAFTIAIDKYTVTIY